MAKSKKNVAESQTHKKLIKVRLGSRGIGDKSSIMAQIGKKRGEQD